MSPARCLRLEVSSSMSTARYLRLDVSGSMSTVSRARTARSPRTGDRLVSARSSSLKSLPRSRLRKNDPCSFPETTAAPPAGEHRLLSRNRVSNVSVPIESCLRTSPANRHMGSKISLFAREAPIRKGAFQRLDKFLDGRLWFYHSGPDHSRHAPWRKRAEPSNLETAASSIRDDRLHRAKYGIPTRRMDFTQKFQRDMDVTTAVHLISHPAEISQNSDPTIARLCLVSEHRFRETNKTLLLLFRAHPGTTP